MHPSRRRRLREVHFMFKNHPIRPSQNIQKQNDLFVDRYTEELKQYAEVLSQSYKTRNERESSVVVDGVNYPYFPDKSTDFYAHYENNNKIIIAIHGAFTVEENIVAIQQSVSVGGENEVIDAFCDKFESLLNETKKVLLLGHSLGCFAIGQCSIRFNTDFDSFLFAPYVPKAFGKYLDKIKSTRRWKKLLYNTDWLANNLVKNESNLANVNLFKNNCFFCFNFLNSHSLENYLKSVDEVNKDILRYFP